MTLLPPVIREPDHSWQKVVNVSLGAFALGFGFLILTCVYANSRDVEKATEATTRTVLNLLLAAGAFGWTASNFNKRRRFGIFVSATVSTIGLFAFSTYLLFSVVESKHAKANDRAWAANAQAGVDKFIKQTQSGELGGGALIAKTGDPVNDQISGAANELMVEFGGFLSGMNGEIDALQMKQIFDGAITSNSTILDTETQKRVQAIRIVGRYNAKVADLEKDSRAAFAAMQVSDANKESAMKGIDATWKGLHPKFDLMFSLLKGRYETELDYLRFLAAWSGGYRMDDGKIQFSTDDGLSQYNTLTNKVADANASLVAFRREQERVTQENRDKISEIGK